MNLPALYVRTWPALPNIEHNHMDSVSSSLSHGLRHHQTLAACHHNPFSAQHLLTQIL